VSFAVRYSAAARDDLIRLYDFLLEWASTAEDLELAERALNAITTAVDSLGRSPFIYRKAGQSPFLRELLIPFGHSGCVALFEIENASTVTILAVRHQLRRTGLHKNLLAGRVDGGNMGQIGGSHRRRIARQRAAHKPP
jgi:plasmid stabilization system protein ParE